MIYNYYANDFNLILFKDLFKFIFNNSLKNPNVFFILKSFLKTVSLLFNNLIVLFYL